MPTIVGVFDNGIDVERAIFDLKNARFRKVHIVDREHELEIPRAGCWIGVDDNPPDLGILRQDMETLYHMGVPEADAFAYAECVQHGKKLVAVRTTSRQAREVLEILSGTNGVTEPVFEIR
jgi:hypothetical protein